ncbi:uncharacterized protein CXorf38-like [Chanos chanos]|uniref:Uncharacterized protein CXorf38-like n=1 Tax=Chanos chanos TaxID=29144 RepID=A0A6J2VXW3_CHACN|nr:uncharacterized protein CXorf38-like [Chanos chanos]
MVLEELSARLNEVGYKNWLKAGYCLLKVKDGLYGYLDAEMRHFHSSVIRNNDTLRRGRMCTSHCRPKGNQLQSVCPLCNEWKTEILRHHTNAMAVVNWGNCRPWLWSSEHWELAKAYMPRGLANVTRADQCDAAALLNLLNFCDHFSSINPQLVREVIRCRNELMHSCEMRVSTSWMEQYQRSVEQLLLQLRHVPEVAAAGRQIQEMLLVDLSVLVPGVDCVDGDQMEGAEHEFISQWETELLREFLQDVLNNAEEGKTLTPEGMEKLKNMQQFLQDHQDLKEQFRTELQCLLSVEERLPQNTGEETMS